MYQGIDEDCLSSLVSFIAGGGGCICKREVIAGGVGCIKCGFHDIFKGPIEPVVISLSPCQETNLVDQAP